MSWGMFTPAPPLALAAAQRQHLEALVRAGTTPQRVAQRCQVILLAGQGVANHAIAQRTGLSRPTVLAARAAFAQGGVEALRQRPRRQRRRPRPHPGRWSSASWTTTLKTRPLAGTHWSVRTLAKHLGVSRMMVQRVWQRHEIQPHRVEKFKLSRDPRFEEKVRDIVGLYLDPPERALVLCVDEKSQIQALDRTAPLLPLRPGLPGAADPRLPALRHDHAVRRLQHPHRQGDRDLPGAPPRPRVREVPPAPGAGGAARPGGPPHRGQLQHAQECRRATVAEAEGPTPVPLPLHADQQFLAEPGGTLVRPHHRADQNCSRKRRSFAQKWRMSSIP